MSADVDQELAFTGSDLGSEPNELNSLKFKAFPMSFESTQTLEVESDRRPTQIICYFPLATDRSLVQDRVIRTRPLPYT